MTEIYGLFDAADPMDPDRVYTSEAFARLFRTMMRDGIVHNDGDELAVSPSVPAAMSVSVGTGMALIQGRYYINDAALTLNVEAADPSHPRIDRVVVQLEATPGRTVHAVVKMGTPAPSPVPPGLTRTAETWELSLAQVRVEAGATSIVAGKITDERGNASLCGVAAPVYVPSSQMEVVGAMNMQGHALTGLPAPSAGTDAARKDMGGATLQNLGAPVNPNDATRKAYVDGKVAGFGVSDITIDADKDWNNKGVTNLKHLGGATYVLIAGSPLSTMCHQANTSSASHTGTAWVTKKSTPACPANRSGTVHVRYNSVTPGDTSYARLLLNGAEIPNTTITGNGVIGDIDVAVVPGDIISVQTRHSLDSTPSWNTLFEVSALMAVPLADSVAW
jgi:hypothetical protein